MIAAETAPDARRCLSLVSFLWWVARPRGPRQEAFASNMCNGALRFRLFIGSGDNKINFAPSHAVPSLQILDLRSSCPLKGQSTGRTAPASDLSGSTIGIYSCIHLSSWLSPSPPRPQHSRSSSHALPSLPPLLHAHQLKGRGTGGLARAFDRPDLRSRRRQHHSRVVEGATAAHRA